MKGLTRCMARSVEAMSKRKTAPTKAIRLLILGAVLALVLIVMTYFAGRVLEKRSYALHYAPEIITYADEYGLDRYLVAAVIHCESGNRRDVISSKGAVGLMQIMPDTGVWVAQKLELSDYDTQKLTDPAVNIRIGCWYLAYLIDKYDANMVHVIAAYNAGPGNIDKWLADEEHSTDGVLDAIPFKQTEDYVNKIQRAYEKYKQLYEKELG
ncbi:MAG: lytic transglycosylase domain-containing protein [Clostridia bacterium]